MFLLFFTFLIGVIFTPSIGSKLSVVFDIENAEILFEKFLITYNKTYSDAEKKNRLEIFQKTLTTLNVINSVDAATFDINRFADLTEKEVFRGHTEDNQKLFQCGCSKITDDDIETRDAPSSLDWRDSGAVSRVKNEGDCRAHWAFAIVGNIEGQYAKAKGEILEFSVQELIDCLSDCDGCGGCSSREALSSLIDLGGLQLDSDYPYVKKQQRTCKFKPVLSKVEVTGCINYNLYDEDNLKEVLAKRGPLYIAINGTPLKNYFNGILSNCPAGDLNHAALLIGYGTEDNTDFWLIKNSWGPKWGVNGFAKIRRGVNACGLMNPQTASAIIE